ncbi:hypothetical protein ABH287_07920, partial [Acinetobacter pittii]
MSNINYEKQAQDYYGKAPIIILGSGASAAHGMSGMGALAQHLTEKTDVSELSDADMESWDNFCQTLRNGIDLETALHQVDVSMIYAELSGDFPLGDSRQPIYKSLRP